MAAKLPSHTTGDFKGPEQFDIDLSSTLAADEIERPDLVVVTEATLDSPHVKEYASDLKFMEDILEIEIAAADDPYAQDPLTPGVNGVIKYLYRGKTYKVARKFVDALIKTSFRTVTKQYVDAQQLVQTKIEQVPVYNCVVQVYSDPAGEVGRRWLQHKLSTAS